MEEGRAEEVGWREVVMKRRKDREGREIL